MESRESKLKTFMLVASGLMLSVPIVCYTSAHSYKKGYQQGWQEHEQKVLRDVPDDREVFVHECLHKEGGLLVDTPYMLFCGHAPNRLNTIDEDLMERLREAHGH